ncbi:hypothetical protein F0726_02423 [Acidithiobacillus caldus]|nr:hypothetical protein F0726_02423 [Acidithiobacillus caldus]
MEQNSAQYNVKTRSYFSYAAFISTNKGRHQS